MAYLRLLLLSGRKEEARVSTQYITKNHKNRH